MIKAVIVGIPMVLGAGLAHSPRADAVILRSKPSSAYDIRSNRLSVSMESGKSQGARALPSNVSHKVTLVSATFAGPAEKFPKPAAWAMSFVGFGATGALLRHRRAAMIAA